MQPGGRGHLATRTGVVTLRDFRQKRIGVGGEGAPLAAYGDALLFREPSEDRILLKIGGIANSTSLPRSGAALSADVGPGNTMMDAFVRSIDPAKGQSDALSVDGRDQPAGLTKPGERA